MTAHDDLDRRLDEEIQFHLEQQIEKNLRSGMAPDEARRAAALKFGGVESAREYTRDEFRWAFAHDFIRDLRIGTRTLLRTPSFALAVVLTFGLGIGAASSMFSVYDGVLLKPLPYSEPGRIVRLFQVTAKGARTGVSEPNFEDWRQATRSFKGMALFTRGEQPVAGIEEPMIATVSSVSREFFEVMGVAPRGGRLFASDELREGAPPVAVVSASFWRRLHRESEGAPSNRDTFRLGSATYTVVGVMPGTFDFPLGTSIWIPREQWPKDRSRTALNFQAIARLGESTGLASARAELSSVSRSLKQTHRDQTTMDDAAAIPLLDVITSSSKDALNLLLAAAVLLLLVAAANVSNLMVARAASRRKEFAVQLALGASHARLTRQLVSEALALCVAGGLTGVVIAVAAVRVFVALGPATAPRLDTVAVNWTGVAVALAVSSAVALVLGLITASSHRRMKVAATLTESSRSNAGSRPQMRMRQALIVTELALTLVLLMSAGLLARSFEAVLAVNPGYRLDDALIVDLTLPWTDGDQSRQVRFKDDLLERVRALPGVTGAAFINDFPLGGGRYRNGRFLEMSRADEIASVEPILAMSEEERATRSVQAEYRLVSPGYFETMGIPLVSGRTIEEQDGPDAPQVAVVSESLARTKWGEQEALGRYLQLGNMDGDFRGLRIVGIVKDVRELSPEAVAGPMVYAAARQRPMQASSFSMVIRGPRPTTIAEPVRRIVRALDRDVPVRLRTIESALDAALVGRKFSLWLIGAFSVTAFALAALGVYGLMAFTVSQRTREIGIRMVLGAETRTLIGLIVRGGLKLAAIGVAIGLGISLVLMRFIEGQLFGVRGSDPVVILGVVAATLGAATAASYVPARRVVRVAPTESLREA